MSVCEIERLGDVDFMSFLKLFFVLLILSVFAVSIFVSGGFAVDGEDVAASAVDRAEVAVVLAYEAVLEAEEAGANVSGLLDRLNVAGGHLAEARMLYGLGDFDGAVDSADDSSRIGEEVRDEAEELKIEAYGSWVGSLWIRITGSIVGVVVVILGTFMAWGIFRRRYFRQV